jgi:hypothetical protein
MPYPGNPFQRWRAGVPPHDTLLFDLASDPGERVNRLDDQRQKAQELLAAKAAFEQSLGELPPLLKVREPADNLHYDRQRAWLEREGLPLPE